jgi:tetratricopeptide (TPR) repeat protein
MTPEQQKVESDRTAFKADPTGRTAQTLIKSMEEYVAMNGFKDSTSARYILEAARLSAEYGPAAQARKWYRNYLINYPDRPGQEDLLAEYISVSEKLNQPKINDVLYKSFVLRFPEDQRTPAYSGKITALQITADSLVREVGMTMFNDSSFRLDEKSANLYVELSQDMVMSNQHMPKASEYLFHAAETAGTLRQVSKSIEIYEWIVDHYPTSQLASTSLFLKAYALDNDLHQYEQAGIFYKEFLAKYPNNEFTESAQFLLDNLGESEEELNRRIMKLNEEQNVQ